MIQKSWYAGHSLHRYVVSAAVMVVIAACGTDSGPGQVPEAANAPAPAASASSTAMPKDLRAAYITSVQREASESYEAVAMDGLVQFENPAQRFVAMVDRNGLSVTPNEDVWHLGMRTVAVGCEGAMVPVTDAEPEAIGNRSEVHRDGLDEWYLNGPLGVEHGFVMREAPACAGPKRISLAIDGDLAAKLDDADGDGRGDAVRFVDGEGRAVASYTDLFVTDATGKTVPAWLSVNAGEIGIVVDDADAVYPLAIDPLVWGQRQKLTASDGALDDQFGFSVSLSGNTALVGSHGDDVGANANQGSVYVFVRSGTMWIEQARLTASDGTANSRLGRSVSLFGDTALLGAMGDNGATGSAYVFVRSGVTWTQQAKLTSNDGVAYDFFGLSVSVSGDTALVGANDVDVGANVDQGAAYVFVRSGTTWTQQAKLTASDGGFFDDFGLSVSLSGDTALVGAQGHAVGANLSQGSAYVFVRSGTTWTEQAQLTASDGAGNDFLGYSVSVSGDTALMGALGNNSSQGSAYVFVRSGTTWTEQAQLTASDGAVGDRFGLSTSLSGDTALVGAQEDDVGANVDQGSAYVFVRSGTTWTQQAKLTASDGAADDRFGRSSALSGDTALVGAYYDNVGANADQGSAYIFVFGKANGDACATAIECASGLCADGVCCNSACGNGATNDCQACSVATGAAVNGTCALLSAVTVCRASVGACDVAEKCTGSAAACPADTKVVAGTSCRVAAGTCDIAETCDGSADNCPMDGVATGGTTCRASAGICDVAETCDGMATTCPLNTFVAAGTNCRSSAGACDVAETCTGSAAECPADGKVAAGTQCRASAGVCDISEVCNGVANACPNDAKIAAGTQCRFSAGVCDTAENCDGATNDCPADAKIAAGIQCRASAGVCDTAENCDGVANACPTDAKVAAGTQCRASVDVCDAAESCNGATNNCPADAKSAAGTECRASAGICDAAESCNGATNNCPADAKIAAGTECRASAGICDAAESCNGATNNCPADAKIAAGTECRASAGICDAAESCNGATNDCPADAKIAAGTECRSTMGPCDVAETCDGNANTCPADAVADVTTNCRLAAGACDIAEKCDGVNKACTPDVLASVGAVCRSSNAECDIAELCTGISVDCPADGNAPDGTKCTDGTCTAGTCTNGSGGAGGNPSGSSSSSSSSSSGQGGESASSSSSSGQGGESASSSSSSGQPGNVPTTDGGCACRAVANPSSDNGTGFGGNALALLGLVALTSRRRRQQ